jgi:hypothetical protein
LTEEEIGIVVRDVEQNGPSIVGIWPWETTLRLLDEVRATRRLRALQSEGARAVLDAAFEWYQCDVPGPDRERAVRELSEAVQDWHAHGGARSPSVAPSERDPRRLPHHREHRRSRP